MAEAVLQRFAAISARISAIETHLFSSPEDVVRSRQAAINDRLCALEAQLGICSPGGKAGAAPEVPEGESAMYKKMHAELISRGVIDFKLVRVSGRYYEESLEHRAEKVGAASTAQLCKTVVMENTRAPAHIVDCSNPKLSKFVMVLVQYTNPIDSPKLESALLKMGNEVEKLTRARVNMRLADEDLSCEMTGFGHNAVTPVCSATNIPVIMSHKIAALQEYFFLGAGEVDLKLGIRPADFCEAFADVPVFVIDCT